VPGARAIEGPVVLRLLLVLGAVLLLAPATAAAGTFSIVGTTIVYSGEDGVDQIAGFDAGDSIRFIRFGGVSLGAPDGTCTLSPGGQSVDCPKDGVDRVLLNLGGGDDVAAVSQSVTLPVIFDGGAGKDGLFGGGGADIFSGGSEDDNIISRDGRAEQVNCGSGNDTAISDDGDTRSSCEEIEGDADGDGVRRPADCDDTNPGIHPGAVDTPDDRVDQDCSGTDATNLDADGDGSPRPQDCNDANRAIHPGAREVIGNGVDENCDTEIAPFPALPGIVGNLWVPSGSRTLNLKLTAKDFPKGTRIEVRCTGRGCPSRKLTRRVRRSRSTVNLHSFLGTRRLGRGARVELRFSRAGRIGRVHRFRMGRPGVPSVDFRCRPPRGRIRDC
jgi:Putative metal-binding motif